MADEPEAEDEAGTRRQDPELLAMGRIIRILAELDDPTKSRVVEWLHDRHHHDHDLHG